MCKSGAHVWEYRFRAKSEPGNLMRKAMRLSHPLTAAVNYGDYGTTPATASPYASCCIA